MLTRQRVWKVLFWGTFFLLTCLGGVIGFAFWYVTDSETVSTLIHSEGKRFLPGSDVNVGRARIRPFLGEINLTHLQINQTLDGAPFQALRLPWTRIGYNPRAMLKGKFEPREVVVAQPTLRLRQRKDGTWNLQGLLADPWPGPMMKTPPILIQHGTVELIDGDVTRSPVILRDVALEIKAAGSKILVFEGSAKGDAFNRLAIKGTIDLGTGKLSIGGDVTRLAISPTLRSRIPAELRSASEQVGMTGGEVDLRVGHVSYDPNANPSIRYDVGIQIRSGVWDCSHLPFTINDLSASLSARDGVIEIERASGVNGPTTILVEESRFVLGDPNRAPLSVVLKVKELELDKRLRAWTPPEFLPLWKDFTPSGRVNAAVKLVRDREGGPLGYGWSVACLDVAMFYRFFQYPLDHIRGSLICENNQIRVNLQTLVGGKPLTATGTIDNPGDDAHVRLHFEGEAMPIDQTLFDAMPPEINKVVGEFHPTGSVRGKADIERTRRIRPDDPPQGNVAIHAFLRLNENCSIKWDGLPYPVSNLTGQLELHPDKWIFREMKGRNGQAEITGSGVVEKLDPGPGPGDRLAVDLSMRAEKLPFDEQLHEALPMAWRKSWEILNPIGSSNVEAEIHVRPDQPEGYHLVIDPRPETAVQLKFGPPRQPGGKDTSGMFTLRMDNVKGRFVSDNGLVKMEDVGFMFYGSPVKFARGQVLVEDSGKFELKVEQVAVEKLRLDHEQLVTIMPPVMKNFARRLDQGRPISKINGDLGLSWSGKTHESVLCDWKNVLVVLNDNTIHAGLPLEHLQGQLDHVRGQFDGQSLNVGGALNLASVSLLGQQITALESPFQVGQGKAELKSIRGNLLGGVVSGRFGVTLDDTPKYETELKVEKADLQHYAKTISGRQTYSGLVSGRLALNGMGNELKNLQGEGEAQVVEGNLGELPFVLTLVNSLKSLKVSPGKNAMFDSADIAVKIRNGESVLDSIKLTGNVISFKGRGTMDVQGHLNLKLNPLAGRDRFHVPFLSDALREASGQLFVVSVRGPLAFPKFELTPLPSVTDSVRSLSRGKGRNSSEEPDVR